MVAAFSLLFPISSVADTTHQIPPEYAVGEYCGEIIATGKIPKDEEHRSTGASGDVLLFIFRLKTESFYKERAIAPLNEESSQFLVGLKKGDEVCLSGTYIRSQVNLGSGVIFFYKARKAN